MFSVTPVAAFQDNYIWVIHDQQQAYAVDPGDAAPLQQYLQRQQLQLRGILITHHHADHIGGLAALARPDLPVWGPATVPGVTLPVTDGAQVTLPWLTLQVLAVPGHTLDHLAYYGASRLFCGDTLFAAGCGRLFEGTAAQLWQSLRRLAALPSATQVYCTHEYTLANERFARVVEPGNSALQLRITEDQARRERGLPTLPSTIALECATNPFLRCAEPAVIEAARTNCGVSGDEAAVFAALRRWKDDFRG